MKKIIILFCLSFCTHLSYSQVYLERFLAYQLWSRNLPVQPSADFFAFIDSDTALAQKLREKWLYQLARQKDWNSFSQHYKPSADINLQCFAQVANLNTGKIEEAFRETQGLWLSGDSQPPACNVLFDLFVKNSNFDERLLTQRIILALEKHNIALARYLLKQYKKPRLQDAQLLTSIAQNPSLINTIEPGELHDYFYLFGLKRLVNINMPKAINLWQSDKTKQFLNEGMQQSFLLHLTLYKALRNHEDEPLWFAKIKPAFYNDAILDWQIRFALKRQDWTEVSTLINSSPNKEQPIWQYWLARALEAKGENDKAQQMYQAIAEARHYYGFLASLRLNKTPHFANELPVENTALLKPYQPILEMIKTLYAHKQTLEASRLLNDFISELPKEEKSAFVFWLAKSLQWHDKSVYLSNNEELSNQLILRFPVIYHSAIQGYAKNYQVPEEFIYAIIRQESGFRIDVVSSAGARGLMQLMPYTALVVAKQEKIAYRDKHQLFSSEKNINIGVAYLKQLIRHYHHHPVLVAAAYNAGPTQVNYWLRHHPPKEMDIWIETLPWYETRNYLKNIIAFATVYQFRLKQKPDLRFFMKPL